jgi:hypothetical protein
MWVKFKDIERWKWGCHSVVECLPSMPEALTSIPSIPLPRKRYPKIILSVFHILMAFIQAISRYNSI